MADDDFEPRLGRARSGGNAGSRRYLHAVLAATARAGGARRRGTRAFAGRGARGAAQGRLLGARGRAGTRRAVVKTRLVRLGGKGLAAARAHLRYIQRDAGAVAGEGAGLYAAREDHADGTAFLARCEGDRHQFRLIVAPEDAALYADLRPLIRRFMARMELDLGTRLDWVAADHRDTLHPHTHVMVRGRDAAGGDLVIAPAYIAHGMRKRVAELVALDLGPPDAREMAARRRLEVAAERYTALDRRLLRDADAQREVGTRGFGSAALALRAGRLRKLEALGFAERVGTASWRLADDLEPRLRALGERGDIVRTMQRALAAAGAERAAAGRRVFDPAAGEPLVGRVLARGLGDELRDRHFLIVDGLDGRTHYVDIGVADAVEPLPPGAIVRVVPRTPGTRAGDRTIAAVARRHGGRYSTEFHLADDPSASRAFAEAHARRLEALRRDLRLERSPDGVWTIGSDFEARAAEFASRMARRRPVLVEMLSAVPLERLATHDGATWLDRELASGAPAPVRDGGFGREVSAALSRRRAWLAERGLGEPGPGAVAALQRHELRRLATRLAGETGKVVFEPAEGERIEGIVRRRIDLASGRFALIEGEHSLALVPWRPVLARALHKPVSGIVRETGTSWSLARGRSLGR